MKVMTIVGTRPELIRLSRIIHRLDSTAGVDHILVHTGQNYDYRLNQIFFEELGLRPPNQRLGVDNTSLGTVLGGILIAAERVILEERPDAVLILGDTNSAIAALMARRLKVPVYHMEAGNRSFNQETPEETNRRLVDHVSDYNLVYTEHARNNLLAEGLHPRTIIKTGSPMREVINHNRVSIQASDVLERLNLDSQQYLLGSLHRAETVDNPRRLSAALQKMVDIAKHTRLPLLLSTHPRTRKRLDMTGLDPAITLHEPFGFFDYCKLQTNARCVLSDSGTIAEESAILQFPSLTIRNTTERPEALEAGHQTLVSVQGIGHLAAFEAIGSATLDASPPDAYQIDNTSWRVVNTILSTYELHSPWQEAIA